MDASNSSTAHVGPVKVKTFTVYLFYVRVNELHRQGGNFYIFFD